MWFVIGFRVNLCTFFGNFLVPFDQLYKSGSRAIMPTSFFLSLPSSSLYPCPFHFPAPSHVESGHVDTTPEKFS